MNTFIGMRALAIIALTSLMFGCAITDPYLQESLYKPKKIEITDEQEKWEVSYLARVLMSGNSRANLVNRMRYEHYERQSALDTGFKVGVGAQMTTDLVVGRLYSGQGKLIGPAAYVAGATIDGLLSQMADLDQASQFFVAAEVEGVVIATSEQASEVMFRAFEHRIRLFAEKRGFETKCIIGCDEGLYRFYHLKQVRSDAYDSYHYNPHMDELAKRSSTRPGDLIVRIDSLPMEEPPADGLRDSIIGFTPAWQTPFGNTASINIWAGPVFDENGEVQIEAIEKGKIKQAPRVTRSLSGLQMGREFYAEIYDSDLAAFYFDNDIYPYEGYFNGKVYNWISESDLKFIEHYLDLTPPTFGDAKH